MRITAMLLSAFALVGVTACGSDDSSASSSGGSKPAAGSTKVDIKDFKYAPKDIEVKKGAKVTFTNDDTASHTATERGSQAIDTGRLKKGQSKVLTFAKAGTFDYYCVYHPFMKGKVTVK